MKKRLAVLMAIGVALMLTIPIMAERLPTCPSENPRIGGLEIDFQIGGPCPSSFVADIGLMAGQIFHIGIGGSLGMIENQPLGGMYLKIGDFTFDIFKTKVLVDDLCRPSFWYGDCKLKIPFWACLFYEDVPFPLYGGFQYSESNFRGSCNSGYSRKFAWVGGIDIRFRSQHGQGEFWLELQTSRFGRLSGLEIGASLGFY